MSPPSSVPVFDTRPHIQVTSPLLLLLLQQAFTPFPPVITPDSVNCQKSIITVDVFLLHSLHHDPIVSEDLPEGLKVFTDHQSALVPAPHSADPLGINRIRRLGTIDRMVSWIKKKIGGDKSRDKEDGTSGRL